MTYYHETIDPDDIGEGLPKVVAEKNATRYASWLETRLQALYPRADVRVRVAEDEAAGGDSDADDNEKRMIDGLFADWLREEAVSIRIAGTDRVIAHHYFFEGQAHGYRELLDKGGTAYKIEMRRVADNANSYARISVWSAGSWSEIYTIPGSGMETIVNGSGYYRTASEEIFMADRASLLRIAAEFGA